MYTSRVYITHAVLVQTTLGELVLVLVCVYLHLTTVHCNFISISPFDVMKFMKRGGYVL